MGGKKKQNQKHPVVSNKEPECLAVAGTLRPQFLHKQMHESFRFRGETCSSTWGRENREREGNLRRGMGWLTRLGHKTEPSTKHGERESFPAGPAASSNGPGPDHLRDPCGPIVSMGWRDADLAHDAAVSGVGVFSAMDVRLLSDCAARSGETASLAATKTSSLVRYERAVGARPALPARAPRNCGTLCAVTLFSSSMKPLDACVPDLCRVFTERAALRMVAWHGGYATDCWQVCSLGAAHALSPAISSRPRAKVPSRSRVHTRSSIIIIIISLSFVAWVLRCVSGNTIRF
jgi:hypothetical protein